MKDINFIVMITLSFLLRFSICLIFTSELYAFIYSFIFVLIYCIAKNYNLGYVVTLVMLDYMIMFHITGLFVGDGVISLIVSTISFIVMNSLLYIILINKIGIETSAKSLNKKSNVYVDKGIKALENDDIDSALNEFKNAIKSHKKNYLGYMGMCDALSKSPKKHIKKLKYYKKKCIKYAPKELKDNIVRRYE